MGKAKSKKLAELEGKEANPNSMREAAQERVLKALGSTLDEVIDRNGMSLLIPKEGSGDDLRLMKMVKSTMQLYGLDGVLFNQGDVVSIEDCGFFTTITVKDHDSKSHDFKYVNIPTESFDKIKEFVINNNFSSYKAFKRNLLSTYNGPDNACFIGIPYQGMNFGFQFNLPEERTEIHFQD